MTFAHRPWPRLYALADVCFGGLMWTAVVCVASALGGRQEFVVDVSERHGV